jgi:NADH-quinone oxidoreductase subunit G
MVTIEIDGKKVQAEPGSMIIEAADDAHIYIPRFCYHKKLSIAANCRMCLVEVEKSAKPLPACATPVTDGMKVYTRSEKAMTAQKAVMEFLLINHPLDCPICDQGGECELQDLSMGFGNDNSLYTEGKRAVDDDDLGPLISTEMTRCIHCTRCVRFGQEIAGIRELGATFRGEHMKITTYVKHTLISELSGNIIDLCPVGALTSKPYRFKARAWELQQHPSVSPHDCLGSNVYVHTRRGQVLRVVPRDNEEINEEWLSDRDRFSYLGITKDRLTAPMIKINGTWQDCDWTTALEFVVEGFQKIVHEQGSEQLGALASPTASLEELFLLQKFWRELGSPHIDHRVHQTDFSDQATLPGYLGLPIPIKEIVNQNKILLIGSNIQREQPIAGHWVRQATLAEAEVMAVNPVAYNYYFKVSEQVTVTPQQFPFFIAEIAKAVITNTHYQVSATLEKALAGVTPTEAALRIAEKIVSGEKSLILLGALAQNHPQAATIRTLARLIAQASQASLGYLTEGPNAAGACIAGVLPHRKPLGETIAKPGLNFYEMCEQPRQGYLFLGLEPELDCACPELVKKALEAAQFVVALSAYKTEYWLAHANVLLPIVPFTEMAGTFINIEGRWQSFSAVTLPMGEARPGWKVLRVLGNFFKMTGFEYLTSEEIRNDLQNLLGQNSHQPTTLPETISLPPLEQQGLTRITEWPLYRADSLVRRSEALQNCVASDPFAAHCNARTAQQYQVDEASEVWVSQGKNRTKLPLVIDARIPDNCVWIPAGFPETAGLAESFGSIEMVAAHD